MMRTVNDKPRYGRTVMTLVCCVALCLVQMCSSFMLPSTPTIASPTFHHVQSSHRALNRASSTALSERRWNFNEGGGPFGLKKNAEIWNGRVAQMCFVFVFLQEIITGKGVVDSIRDGDPVGIACVAATAITIAGLTVFLGLKGSDDYVNEELRRK